MDPKRNGPECSPVASGLRLISHREGPPQIGNPCAVGRDSIETGAT